MLKLYLSEQNLMHLVQVRYEPLCLRKLVSYSVRIEGTSDRDFSEMISVGKKVFRSCCLYGGSISPRTWYISLLAPVHCQESIEKLKLGLGINTMEDREQKHQIIKKYSDNTTVQDRWPHVFRHEFIQLVYLREHGFDLSRYRKRNTRYIPDLVEGHCACDVKLTNLQCDICNFGNIKKIIAEIDAAV